jgi:hypothetical protein
LPILINGIKAEVKNKIINNVNKIIELKKNPDFQINQSALETVKEYEYQINQEVYKLYDLTAEEISIVEGQE